LPSRGIRITLWWAQSIVLELNSMMEKTPLEPNDGSRFETDEPSESSTGMGTESVSTAAIIGSFRQYYREVCEVWRLFTDLGLEVKSPKGTPIIEEGVPFVRFTSDAPEWDDPMVQTVALHRILGAQFTYVVAPRGYVGRTTCYEIGRIIQAKRPLYFSEHPGDLPVQVPSNSICAPEQIADLIRARTFVPQPLYIVPTSCQSQLEQDLLMNRYRTDDELTS
jgi:hypothetical protein